MPTYSNTILGWTVDLRQAVRALRRSPVFLTASVASVALAIGGTTLAFAAIKALADPTEAIAGADRIVELWQSAQADCARACPDVASRQNVHDWEASTRVFEAITAARRVPLRVAVKGSVTDAQVAAVLGNFFSVLRTRVKAGRALVPNDDAPGAEPVVVVSEASAERLFANKSPIDHTIQINGRTGRVVGVMPRGFETPQGVDIWIPDASFGDAPPPHQPAYTTLARLRAGISQADADRAFAGAVRALFAAGTSGPEPRVGFVTRVLRDNETVRPLWMLLTATVVLLIVATTNIAALFTSRALARLREAALRLALGAPRHRVAAVPVAEVFVIAAIGGTAGLAVAIILARRMEGLLIRFYHLSVSIHPDLSTAGFALGLGVLVALTMGAAPVLGLRHADPQGLIRGERASGSVPTWEIARRVLAVVQVAMVVVLVTVEGVMATSSWNAMTRNVGYDVDHIIVSTVPVASGAGISAGDIGADVAGRINELRGVRQVTAWSYGYPRAPVPSGTKQMELDGGRAVPFADVPLLANDVTASFFRVFGLKPSRGRLLTDEDQAGSEPVVLVNEDGANRWWPSENPIGKQLRLRGGPWMTVVGVVPDAVVGEKALRLSMLSSLHWPAVYRPLSQTTATRLEIGVRMATEPSPENLRAISNTVTASLAPGLPITPPTTLRERMLKDGGYDRVLLSAWLIGAVALIAVVVALVGVYGAVDMAVRRRTRELGVRMALGATAAHILGVIGKAAATMTGLGVGIGVALALSSSASFRRLAAGGANAGTGHILAVGGFVFFVAMVAAWVPAWRASRTSPVVALRSE